MKHNCKGRFDFSKKVFWHIISKYRGYRIRKSEKEIKKQLQKYETTQNIKKLSVSAFKRGEFIDKESGICFSYRIKASKERNKPLVLFFHGAGSIGKDNIKQLYEFIAAGKQLSGRDCTVVLPQTPFSCRMHNESWEKSYIKSVKTLVDLAAEKTGADKCGVPIRQYSRN